MPGIKYTGFLIFFLLMIATLVISHFNFDLSLAHIFYRDQSWYLAKDQPWIGLYRYGIYPGIIVGLISLLILVVSLWNKKLKTHRRQVLLILLTLIVGPGLIVNAIFKDHWGRPRPRQITEFGGKWEFREVWEPRIFGPGHSFPSGHASMGFYFMVFYFVLKRRNKMIAHTALVVGIGYGLLLGITRIVQGGHFASDVLWAAGFTYLTADILYHFILKIPQLESKENDDG